MVVGAWVLLAAVLLLALPPLAVVAEKHPPPLLPENSAVLKSNAAMKDAFHEGDSANLAVVVLSNENGLNAENEVTYRALVDKLLADTKDVADVQDFVRIPELRSVMTSKDHKAWNLPVNLTGTMGTPEGQTAYQNAAKVVRETTADTGLTANIVGAAATFDDVTTLGAEDQHLIEIATIVTVLTILIIVYRNLVAMVIPLITIGASLVVAQQVVAGLGMVGLGLGPQTLVLMTGMMIGAGTDYAVFLFSRYQECVRHGESPDDAIVSALGSIGGVIAGSAGTVAITFFGLGFATLGVFATVGPALAITIAIGFLASITLLPALIVMAGRRGWVKPRRDLTGKFWRRSGIHIVRRPRIHLVTSLVILVALAFCATLTKYNYDDRKNLPEDSPSNLGYAAMDKHFPISSTLQQFILIQSPGDLRTPKALADMEMMAARVAQLPNIEMVRGITRPSGEMLEQAKATYQAGEVGSKLGDASQLISANDANLTALSSGANQMADALNQVRNTVVGGLGSIRGVAAALEEMQRKFGGTKTLDEIDKSASLVTNMRELGDSLGVNVARISDISAWATPLVNALNTSPQCDSDPGCVDSRADLQRLVAAGNDPAMQSIAELGRQLQTAQGSETLDDTVGWLNKTITTATAAARKLGIGDASGLQTKLNTLLQGANTLADSSRQLALGVQTLVDQTRVMGNGMDQASAFLLAMKRGAADPPMSGFYIPPEILTQAEFKKAAALFVSEDGHTARYLVQTSLDPFSTAAMDQVGEIIKTAESARPNTTLAEAHISMVGFSAVNNDVRNYYNSDVRFIVIFTLIVVFFILMILLRAIVAPIYLVLSVILSYMSALGIGVVFFQFVLHQDMAWSVPGLAFLVLVAVGADYNLLLISRIRDESRLGVRSGVIRTVGATGGVITSAGLIFAASMLGMAASSIKGIVQMGVIIAVGLLLDTFLVRTITVPAIAVLLGKANWWPSNLAKEFAKADKEKRAEESAAAELASADSAPGSAAD